VEKTEDAYLHVLLADCRGEMKIKDHGMIGIRPIRQRLILVIHNTTVMYYLQKPNTRVLVSRLYAA